MYKVLILYLLLMLLAPSWCCASFCLTFLVCMFCGSCTRGMCHFSCGVNFVIVTNFDGKWIILFTIVKTSQDSNFYLWDIPNDQFLVEMYIIMLQNQIFYSFYIKCCMVKVVWHLLLLLMNCHISFAHQLKSGTWNRIKTNGFN